MSLLTTPYNPTAAVEVLVNAMEAGKRRQAQQEQITAGLAKAIADDRRHALEWDRLQAFNQAKEATDNAHYDAKVKEERRRYEDENATVSLPPRVHTGTEAPITQQAVTDEFGAQGGADTGSLTADPGIDLYASGGAAPKSSGLLPPVVEPDDYAGILAKTRTEQLQQGLGALDKVGPDAAETANIQQQLAQAMGGSGPMGLPAVNPLRETAGPDVGALGLDPGAPPRADGLPAGKGELAGQPLGLMSNIPAPTVGERVYDTISQVAGSVPGGLRRKDLRPMVTNMTASAFAAEERARNRGAASGKPGPMTMESAIAQYGLTPNPEGGTYKARNGMEYYVGQGVGGGVSLTPKRPGKEDKDRIIQSGGNVWLVPPNGGDPRKIISKEVSDTLSNSITTRFATAVAKAESGRANLDESTRVWEARKAEKPDDADGIKLVQKLEKEVQTRQAALRTALAEVKSLRTQYPKLGEGYTEEPDASPAAPAAGPANAEEKAATLQAAKAKMATAPSKKDAIRSKLIANGFTEAELQAAGL